MEPAIESGVDRIVEEHSFSGVVGIEYPGQPRRAYACGMADRAHGIPNTVEHRFGVALVGDDSGS